MRVLDISPYYLEKMVLTLGATLDNPDLGTEVEHIRPDYLCFQHRSHLIFFKKRKEGVLIVRLLHTSMEALRHFN